MNIRHFITVLFLFVASAAFSLSINPGNDSGKIIFDISYPDSKLDEQSLSQMPTESIVLFRGDKTKVEVAMPMGKTVVITDNKTGNAVMLMDMMGSKMAMEMDKEQILKEKNEVEKPVVQQTDESKKIAGLLCKKAIVTMQTKDGDFTFDAWFTKELNIKNSVNSQIEGIDGFLMEFQTVQNGMSMKMSARSFEKMDVSESEFEIPEGYQKISMEDMIKMGGPGGR